MIGYSFTTQVPDDPAEREERRYYMDEGYQAYQRGESRSDNPHPNPPTTWTKVWDPNSAWDEGFCDAAWDD